MALTTVSSLDEAFTAAPAIISGEGDVNAETDGQKTGINVNENAMAVETSNSPNSTNGQHEEIAQEIKAASETDGKDEQMEVQPPAEQTSEETVVEGTPAQEHTVQAPDGDGDAQI
jgi:nucleotide-binding universal stress UspA family protein